MSSGRVINHHNRNRYTIEKYEFGASGGFDSDVVDDDDEFITLTESLGHKPKTISEYTNSLDGEKVDNSFEENSPAQEQQAKQDSQTIELLYKKIEELSDKVVKYEMALESKDAEVSAIVSNSKAESYQEGYEACSNEIRTYYNSELDSKQKMLASSMNKLESCVSIFEKKLEEIQKELVTTALAISHEIIKIEVSQRSSDIALKLSKELLLKLQDATSIMIKVNSDDLAALKADLGENSKISLEADDAIAKGGVIVMSSMGNLDGTIASRLEKVIKEATQQ